MKSLTVNSVFVLGAIIAMAGTAYADLIIEKTQTSSMGVTNQNQAMATVVVGAADVPIGKFGIYGQAQVNGNIKWIIFDNLNHSAPVYLSALQPVTGTPGAFSANAKWFDSPEINFTLLAGHTYAMGVIADQVGTNTFRWASSPDNPFGPWPTTTANGLSLPFNHSLVNSGLSSGVFVNTPTLYTVTNSNRSQHSFRAYSPVEVPEPSMLIMLSMGVVALAFSKWRQR
jgi:hypothetical protein